ncbi:MAG: hypothetical protein LLG04_16420 [Parachlamydia sp.]|nr:hypothetical protein [Parachlamydia sp.]
MSLQGDYRNPNFVESAKFCHMLKQEMSKVDTTTTLATHALKRKSEGEGLNESLSRKSIKIIDSSKLERLLEGAKNLEEEIQALKQSAI